LTQAEVERELDEEDELRMLEKQDEEDFVEEEEVRQRISEVQQTVDEEENMVLGDLPLVVGETVAWPQNPAQAQLDTPIGHDLEEYVRGRGASFERAVRMEAGGDVVTLGMLIEVVKAWEEDEVQDKAESMTSMSVLLETREEGEEEERGGDLFMGALGLCLMMIASNRQREDEREEMEEQESRMDGKELEETE
jgi:hypothetical protein